MTSSAAEQPRVVILPTEIAGYATRVAAGLRANGWRVDVVDLSGNPYGHSGECPGPWSLRMINRIHAGGARGGHLSVAAAAVISAPLRLWAALVVVPRYDAVISLFGRTLAAGIDLRTARVRGTRIVAVYLGSDSRPPYLSGNYLNRSGPVPWRLVRFRTRQMRRRVARMERLSDVVACHPASAQFLTRPFVNWLAVGMPAPDGAVEARPPRIGSPVRALLAPSRPEAKGTAEIRRAVTELGPEVELRVLTGVPNATVMAALDECDVVLDELYSDTPIAGLGSEAAARGVAAFTFGYAGEFLAEDCAALGVPLGQYATPQELPDVVRRIVTDPQWVAGIAATTHAFVTRDWSSESVGGKVARILQARIPEHWFRDPASVDYAWGYGMDQATAVAGWREYVRRYGIAALELPASSRAGKAIRAAVGRVT